MVENQLKKDMNMTWKLGFYGVFPGRVTEEHGPRFLAELCSRKGNLNLDQNNIVNQLSLCAGAFKAFRGSPVCETLQRLRHCSISKGPLGL